VSQATSRLFSRFILALTGEGPRDSLIPDREGAALDVHWDPEPGVDARAVLVEPGATPVAYATAYAGPSARPADYPLDVPFLVDQPVVVLHRAGRTETPAAYWVPALRSSGIADRVVVESRTAGWSVGSVAPGGIVPGSASFFELWRGAERRLLIETAMGEGREMVGLFDSPRHSSTGAAT
jgi:hypothetical protein